MKTATILLTAILLSPTLLFSVETPETASATPAEPSADSIPTKPSWPVRFTIGDFSYAIHRPEIEQWQTPATTEPTETTEATGTPTPGRLTAWAAVEATTSQEDTPVTWFGLIAFEADTAVDAAGESVTLSSIRATTIDFPADPPFENTLVAAIRGALPTQPRQISIDLLQSELAIQQARQKGNSTPLGHQPPRILFSENPAILLPIAGDPILETLPGTPFRRVVNTPALLLANPDNHFYLHLFDGWMEAPSFTGPWTISSSPPDGIEELKTQLSTNQQVDLLQGQPHPETGALPSLQTVAPPAIIVASRPTELIVTDGPPEWVNLATTGLEYVENSPANWLRDSAADTEYLLLSGRWFARSPSDPAAAWSYLPGHQLPSAFQEIPDTERYEALKAAIPHTRQAAEAFIAAKIPQTGVIPLAATLDAPAEFLPEALDLRPIEGTALAYVANSPVPLIRHHQDEWFLLEDGVWFVASSPNGPWTPATALPPEIYAIPPTSPLYHATFVRTIESDDDSVTSAVYPGYTGTIPASDGTIVYGTGYDYVDLAGPVASFYYPVTYGYLTSFYWAPTWGWYFDYGWTWGWRGGPRYWVVVPRAPFHRGISIWRPYSRTTVFTHRGWWGPNRWATSRTVAVTPRGVRVGSTVAGFNTRPGGQGVARFQSTFNPRTGTTTSTYRAQARDFSTGTRANTTAVSRVNPVRGTTTTANRTTVANPITNTRVTNRVGTHTNVRSGNVTNAALTQNNRGPAVGAVARTNAFTGQTRSAQVASDQRGTVVRTQDGAVFGQRNGQVFQRNPGGGWNPVNRSAIRQAPGGGGGRRNR